MMKTVDCRGLACPQPVIHTKAAMAEGAEELIVLVDSETSASNVSHMAEKAGWSCLVQPAADGFQLHLRQPAAGTNEPALAIAGPAAGPTVLLVKSQHLGVGNDELGAILMRAFFHTLTEMEQPPQTLLFLNGGVRLTVIGSEILDDLRLLAERGVEIQSCGTCLKFFGLSEQLAVGRVSNMYAIAEALMGAGRIITP